MRITLPGSHVVVSFLRIVEFAHCQHFWGWTQRSGLATRSTKRRSAQVFDCVEPSTASQLQRAAKEMRKHTHYWQ